MRKALLKAAGLLAVSVMTAAASPQIGDKAPGFMLNAPDGSRVSLGSLMTKGQPVVVSFFATWCEPCLKEIPLLQRWVESGKGTAVLVNIDIADPRELSVFLSSRAITLPVLMDPGGSQTGVPYGYMTNGMARVPRLFMIAPDGKIQYISDRYEERLPALLDSAAASMRSASAMKRELAVLFTNSTNGYFESCDCPNHPYGGLVRRASYVAQQRKIHTGTVLIDSGDFLPPYVSTTMAAYSGRIHALLKYDAILPGDQEFSSPGFIEGIAGSSLPFISSNVSYCEGGSCRQITPSMISLTRAGFRIGIVSYVDPDVFALYPESVVSHLSFLPLNAALAGAQRKRAEYDLLILISHAGVDRDKQIARDYPFIDIIAGGHSQTLLSEPVRVGNTLIVQTGENGQNVGKLVYSAAPGGAPQFVSHELIPLTKAVPDDPAVRALVTEFTLLQRKK